MTERFRARQLAFREREILRAARAVLDEVGCRRFTMEAVAARLGISKGTVYRHFQSREELIRRMVGEAWEAVVEAARRAGGEGPIDRRRREVMGLLVRRLLGLDQRSPCCLEEIECPFLDRSRLQAPLDDLGEGGLNGLVSVDIVRALAGSIRADRRARGRGPTEGDAAAVLDLLLRDP